MLNELPTTTKPKRAEHPLTLSQIRLLVLLMLNVQIERLALQENLQIAIILQNRMRSRLIKHTLQCSSSGLDEIGIESANGLLLWWRRYHDAGIIAVEGIVQPEEITITS